jgi:recombination protein RecR
MAYHLLQNDRPGRSAWPTRCSGRSAPCAIVSAATPFTEAEICRCLSSKRDASLLCVVETPVDMNMMEQTHAYSGLYYVLMGRVSPLDGIGPRELHLERLLARASDGVVRK